MDKKVIEKIINTIIQSKEISVIKCSRTTLRKKDKEFIQHFEEIRNTFPKDRKERKELYKKHVEVQLKHKYTENQRKAAEYWGNEGYWKINGKIYNTNYYKKKKEHGLIDVERMDKIIKTLQSAITDSPMTPHNTVTVRTGHWEKGHKTGEVIVQKGFASTSYTDRMDASDTESEYSYEITYYICENTTRGLVLTEKQFPDCLPEEELLLGRNTRQYVLEQDDDAQTVSLLILPDM